MRDAVTGTLLLVSRNCPGYELPGQKRAGDFGFQPNLNMLQGSRFVDLLRFLSIEVDEGRSQ
jgi:hypothetical protein